MLDLEKQALTRLTKARHQRFTWLCQQRLHLAQTVAETMCFGVSELPALDRQVELVEEALLNLVPDPGLAAELAAEYAVRDAQLMHRRNRPPAGFACTVCSGQYSLEMALSRIPSPTE